MQIPPSPLVPRAFAGGNTVAKVEDTRQNTVLFMSMALKNDVRAQASDEDILAEHKAHSPVDSLLLYFRRRKISQGFATSGT
jgi:hypothetical protein